MQLVSQLDGLPGDPLHVKHTSTEEADGLRMVRHRDVDGALIVDGSGTQDTLLVATGGGTSTAEVLAQLMLSVEAAQNRTLDVRDVAPAAAGDARGLTSFFLVIGWVVGGYLCAAVLAISAGSRASTVSRALFRLGALLIFSLLSGLGGAVIVGPVLDALPGRLVALALVGALVVFATGAVTLALQALLGAAGIGLTLLIVVVLGNPSAGGAIGTSLLPTFWRGIGSAMITGRRNVGDPVHRVLPGPCPHQPAGGAGHLGGGRGGGDAPRLAAGRAPQMERGDALPHRLGRRFPRHPALDALTARRGPSATAPGPPPHRLSRSARRKSSLSSSRFRSRPVSASIRPIR